MKIRLLILTVLILNMNALGQVGYNEEFQLSTTSGDNRMSKITLLENNFLLTWINENKSIVGQIYDIKFNKINNTFQIPITINYKYDYFEYDLSILPNGNLVFIWYENGIVYQILNKYGETIKSKSIIQTNCIYPAITCYDDNKFFVTWTEEVDSNRDEDIFGIIYNENGSVFKSKFLINEYTYGTQYKSVMKNFSNGKVIICYINLINGQDYRSQFQIQIFNLNGDKIGTEKVYGNNGYYRPDMLVFDNNTFLLCWLAENISIQKFDESADPIGDKFCSNPITTRSGSPKISTTFDNKLFYCHYTGGKDWEGIDGNESGIAGKLITSELKPKCNEFVVNDYIIGNQFEPDCETLSDGKILVTWTSRGEIFGKYYLPKEQNHELVETHLVTPSYDETLNTTTPYFEWNKANLNHVNFPWEVYYDLYISNDENFTNPFVVYSITDTSYNLKKQLDNGQIYYWKVLSNTYYGDSLWSSQTNGFYISADAVTDIENESITTTKFSILQNYPNPFNPTTTISYTIPKQSNVKLVIYDMQGREVQILVNENKTTGNYSVDFNATGLSSGIYFYQFLVGSEFVETRKMVFLK